MGGAVRQAGDQARARQHRAELRAELVSLELRLVKWIVGAASACAGLVIAVLRLFGGWSRHDDPEPQGKREPMRKISSR